jgi:hypothetical protein
MESKHEQETAPAQKKDDYDSPSSRDDSSIVGLGLRFDSTNCNNDEPSGLLRAYFVKLRKTRSNPNSDVKHDKWKCDDLRLVECKLAEPGGVWKPWLQSVVLE